MVCFNHLPIHVLWEVAQYLSTSELLAVSRTCQLLRLDFENLLYIADGRADNPLAAQWAALTGEIDVLRKIIKYGAKLEESNFVAAFEMAAEMQEHEVITLMVSLPERMTPYPRPCVVVELAAAMLEEDHGTTVAILRGLSWNQEALDAFFQIVFTNYSAHYLKFAETLLKRDENESIYRALAKADTSIRRTIYFTSLRFLVDSGFEGSVKVAVSRALLWQASNYEARMILDMFTAELEPEINHDFGQGYTLLSFAIIDEKISLVKRLLQEKATKIDIRNIRTTSIIGLAYETDNWDPYTPRTTSGLFVNTIAEALEERTGVSKQEALAVRDIWTAAENDDLATVQNLIEVHGYSADLKDDNWATPLARAASKESVEVVAYLVRLDGVDVHASDKLGRTPLTRAAKTKNDLVVNPILNVEDMTLQGMASTIRDAVLKDLENNGLTTLPTVYEHLTSGSPPKPTIIYEAAAAGDVSMVSLLLSAVVTERPDVVVSAFVIAAFFGHLDLLEELRDAEEFDIHGEATSEALEFLTSCQNGIGKAAQGNLDVGGLTAFVAAEAGGYPDVVNFLTTQSEVAN